MRELIYVVIFNVLAIGAAIGERIMSSERVHQPLHTLPLQITTGAAGLVALGWFIYGFFPFSWWLPIAAAASFALGGAFLVSLALHKDRSPLYGTCYSILGILFAIAFLIVGD